ncbi:DUF6314 family protein [Pengzhenrongella sp.]|uniref:DUF6314 family protein n=1 Tax=Pengzhenrongella sp. TaxID=2888820 RepID=UPI002F941A01
MPDVDRLASAGAPLLLAVPDVTSYLLGTWSVERELLDRSVRVAGTFRGTATFRLVSGSPGAPDGAALPLEHAESGELSWSGVVGTAERTLWMHPEPDGTARVRFGDGRAFHDLDLRTGRWIAHHPCAADTYTGTFTVRSDDEWRVRWDVTGPTKDQRLSTVYRRT